MKDIYPGQLINYHDKEYLILATFSEKRNDDIHSILIQDDRFENTKLIASRIQNWDLDSGEYLLLESIREYIGEKVFWIYIRTFKSYIKFL